MWEIILFLFLIVFSIAIGFTFLSFKIIKVICYISEYLREFNNGVSSKK